MLDACLSLLEEGYYEATFAFEGLADAHVWARPAKELLSVGEIAGHMAYWEAIRLAGEGEDLTKCHISSPLVDNRFAYYPKTLASSPSAVHLIMTAAQVSSELMRVHHEAIEHFKAIKPDPEARIPGCPTGFTYEGYLKYAVFHTAYHIGQIYSVRHLLGEAPPDN